MQRRGVLVRDVLPAEMRAWKPEIAAALQDFGTDMGVQGRDATGRKSRVPWARFYSERKSPLATVGWYVVYLFHPDGSGVSLCLSHGSTTFEGGVYKGRSGPEVDRLMNWGRGIVSEAMPADKAIRHGVGLGNRGLARQYERTTLLSKFYETGTLPSDNVLGSDLVTFATLLEHLYTADDDGRAPDAENPDIADAMSIIEEIAAPLKKRGSGQGRTLNPETRRAIELRAMEAARKWLMDQGFTSIKDISRNHSCDYSAKRDGKTWFVEVKGTTGGPRSILLTRNEVILHKAKHPTNVLLVLHGIQLSKDRLKASGGELVSISPWQLDDAKLSATAYEYRLD